MARVYVRKFDHDEAVRRVTAGESMREIAQDYGVSHGAIYLAVKRLTDPGFAKAENARVKRSRTVVCEVCGGPACALIKAKLVSNPDGRVLCGRCRGVEKRERLRFDEDGKLIAVRCNMRDCANGERWQPPYEFPGGVTYRDVRANGIHSVCRACNTRMRRRSRERLARAV